MEVVLLLIRIFLAAVFALAGIGKLLDLEGSEKAVKGFGVNEELAKPLAIFLPAAELLIALALLPVSTSWLGAIGGFTLLAIFIGGMIWQMAKGNAPDCHCFGAIHSEPVSKKSLIRNLVFAILAFILVARGAGGQGLSLTDLESEMAIQLILGLATIGLLGAVVFYLKKNLIEDQPADLKITPRTGDGLIFRHDWWHEGRTPHNGRKYVLRTDVICQQPMNLTP